LQTRIESEVEEEEAEESAAIKHQKLTVSNVLKTLELFLNYMVITRRRRRRRIMQRIESLLLLRRSLETCFPQLGPGRRRPRNGSEASYRRGRNMRWKFGWELKSRNLWDSKEST
jgi:hypothetical protein